MKNNELTPVTRETVAEELGADLAIVEKAEASLRSIERSDFDPSLLDLQSEDFQFESPDAVAMLNCFGLLEAFAIHCVRLNLNEGALSVLVPCFPEWNLIEGGLYLFRASFSDIGEVDSFSCDFDGGFPRLGVAGRVINRSLDSWRSTERNDLIQLKKAVGDYMNLRKEGLRLDFASPQTVIRHRQSPSQSFRKLLLERWCDPTLPPSIRFERMPVVLDDWKRFFAIAEDLHRDLETALEPKVPNDY